MRLNILRQVECDCLNTIGIQFHIIKLTVLQRKDLTTLIVSLGGGLDFIISGDLILCVQVSVGVTCVGVVLGGVLSPAV